MVIVHSDPHCRSAAVPRGGLVYAECYPESHARRVSPGVISRCGIKCGLRTMVWHGPSRCGSFRAPYSNGGTARARSSRSFEKKNRVTRYTQFWYGTRRNRLWDKAAKRVTNGTVSDV